MNKWLKKPSSVSAYGAAWRKSEVSMASENNNNNGLKASKNDWRQPSNEIGWRRNGMAAMAPRGGINRRLYRPSVKQQ
jgi:hypothetical protein